MNSPQGARPLAVHLALFTVSLIFGINSVTSKMALREIDPFALVVLRVTAASVILWTIHRFTVREKIQSAGDYARLALYSVFGIVINQMLFLKGLSLTTAIDATVLVTAIPIVTILIAILLRKEKASARKIIGSLIAFCGVILLLGSEEIDLSNDYFVGNLLVFLNGVSFAVYLVISKDILTRYTPSTVVTWNFIFGAIGVLPFGLKEAVALPYADISMTAWLCTAFLILFSSVLVYTINGWALQRTSSSTVAAYIYVQPVIATLISRWLLHEELTMATAIASLLIGGGVLMVSLTMRAEMKEDTRQRMDLITEAAALKEE